MNVLSLFDGMSCGQLALDRLGVKVDNYFASEIEKHAITVAMKNYPSTIQIGDVSKVDGKSLPKIDLLIGGSPCTNLSQAGKREGLSANGEDILSLEQYLQLKAAGTKFTGQSHLFWEYVRLREECQPKYFFLENVKMSKKWEKVFSDILGCEPIHINSSLLTAHNRPRIYWTNIPGASVPEDMGIVFRDIVDSKTGEYEFISDEKTSKRELTKNYLQYDINGTGHGSQDQRAYYMDGKHGCLDTGAAGKAKILCDDDRVRKITRTEAERLQGIPDGYTSCTSRAQAFKMLGNGWTVPVIEHLFKGLL